MAAPKPCPGNTDLHAARRNKRDEFYTQTEDIEAELRHYRQHFADKTVYLNCDDPYESNFFRYFALNFNRLKLERLISTSYSGSPVAGERLRVSKYPHVIDISGVADYNNDGRVDLADVKRLLKNKANSWRRLRGDPGYVLGTEDVADPADRKYRPGDFRSAECVALLAEADIVVTNPPFSLFSEYIAQLIEHDKQFLTLGNMNAIGYKEVFPLIRDERLWLGPSISSGDREFRVPSHYPLTGAGCRVDENGLKYVRVKGVRWFTNLDHAKRHEDLILTERYSPEAYPTDDNYDAINVGKVALIPKEYDGPIGVPITYLDKHNPRQFEILDANEIRRHAEASRADQGQGQRSGRQADVCAHRHQVYPWINDGTLNGTKVYKRIAIRRRKP